MAQPIFEEYIGKFHIKAIEFETLSLGNLPPTISGESTFCVMFSCNYNVSVIQFAFWNL